MTKIAELGYLTEIQLLDKKIVREEVAITGNDLLDLTKRNAPLYVEFVDRKKSGNFKFYFEWALCGAWNIHDKDVIEYLKEREGKIKYIELMRDREVNPHIGTRTILEAKYWMHGGENRGWNFRCGIDTKLIKANNMGYPLRNIKKLSDVKNDTDFWGWVETWLKNNWRNK